jgi:hypothetical protein
MNVKQRTNEIVFEHSARRQFTPEQILLEKPMHINI